MTKHVSRFISLERSLLCCATTLKKYLLFLENPSQMNVILFAAYNCSYVTCDYNEWAAWSASCGSGMRRTRSLAKVNEHYIKKQGGCAGLKVTCDRQQTETKTTNCKFRKDYLFMPHYWIGFWKHILQSSGCLEMK